MIITIKIGDITQEPVDAIVNAAHEYLMGGGGVDGEIHKAAGEKMLQECLQIPQKIDANGDTIRCDTGEVHITGGYSLPAKHVIHTVGPRCINGVPKDIDKEFLYNCWSNSLKIANDKGLKTIAFPSIATGAFAFPIEMASQIAINAIRKHVRSGTEIEEVRIVCFSESDKENYKRALKEGK